MDLDQTPEWRSLVRHQGKLVAHVGAFTRIGADFTGRVSIEWGVYGIPETFVIDQGGRIVCKHIGPSQASDLARKIMPAIEALKRGESGRC